MQQRRHTRIFLCLMLLAALLLSGCQKPPQAPESAYTFAGNCFDNKFDSFCYIDPQNGEAVIHPEMKCSETYYPHDRGVLYFKATKPCETLVFLFYNADKEYIGYHAFSGQTEGQYSAAECGYFRCYTKRNFDGEIYFSTVVPDTAPDYAQKLSPAKGEKGSRHTVVNLGDSIFGNVQNATSISAKLTKKRGDVVYNCGFGGATLGPRMHEQWDAFCFASLADAICSGDYTAQHTALESGIYFPDYFDETLALLAALDWSEVDLITIAYGTNDYTENVDIATTTAALRQAVQCLQEKLPHVKILVITPIWRYFEDGTDSDVKNYCGNGTLVDYKNAILATAEALGIRALDAYTGLPMLKSDPGRHFPADDHTHINETGREEYAKLINTALDEMLK